MSTTTTAPPPLRPIDALTQVFGMRRYNLTQMEAEIWKRIIAQVPAEKFLAFLEHHVLHSSYAPTHHDAARFLGLADDPDVLMHRLSKLVEKYGPWQLPPATEMTPLLVRAIQHFGGWSRVNEELPDISKTFEMKAFKDRFSVSIRCAQTDLASGQDALEMPELKALGNFVTEANKDQRRIQCR